MALLGCVREEMNLNGVIWMNELSSATRLLTAFAHDIRTPLNAITLKLVLIELKLVDRLDDQDREDFQSLHSSIQAILNLQKEILDHARLSDGHVVPDEIEFPVDEVLTGCLQFVEPLARKKGLSLVGNLSADATVRSDRSMIQQIVTNLLSNAIRYTHRGYVTMRSRLDNRGLCIEVEDSGIGIGEADRMHVFDEYFRANAARQEGVGFGLGLAGARHTASLLGGTLSVESEVGRGSTFRLSLPSGLLVSPANSTEPCQNGQPKTTANGSDATVRRQVVVQNESGMHFRAASCFVQLATIPLGCPRLS